MSRTFSDTVQGIVDKTLGGVYTALPAKVTKVAKDVNGTVVDCKVLVNKYENDGAAYETPVLPEVPLLFTSTKSVAITFPVEIGDLVLLVFSMRPIDEFYASNGQDPETPFSKRTHDISDAVAIPFAFTSQTAHEVDPEKLQLRNGIDKTESNIDIDKSGKIVINAATSVEIGEGATESLVLGNAFKDYFDNHTHPTGVGPSGKPIVPMPANTLSTYATTK